MVEFIGEDGQPVSQNAEFFAQMMQQHVFDKDAIDNVTPVDQNKLVDILIRNRRDSMIRHLTVVLQELRPITPLALGYEPNGSLTWNWTETERFIVNVDNKVFMEAFFDGRWSNWFRDTTMYYNVSLEDINGHLCYFADYASSNTFRRLLLRFGFVKPHALRKRKPKED